MRAAHHYCAGQRRRRDRIAAAMIQRARDRCRAVALVGWRERTAECVARRALLKRALGNPTLGYPLYGDGLKTSLRAGQGIFLPREVRVKWVWLEATTYFVLCLPAFSPDLSGREAEEGATVAKDSASMKRLEALHEERRIEGTR